jgi:hypothetical protein
MEIPPEVMAAAREIAAGERKLMQTRLSDKRKELKRLNRAHQELWNRYRLERNESKRWREEWKAGSRYISVLARELAVAKGWDMQSKHFNLSQLAKEAN